MVAFGLRSKNLTLFQRAIGSLSSDVFELRRSTGSEPFSLLVCLDATKFISLSVQSVHLRLTRAQKRRLNSV